jgi:hypothetical protein
MGELVGDVEEARVGDWRNKNHVALLQFTHYKFA